MKYSILITSTLEFGYEIEASSEEEAEQLVEKEFKKDHPKLSIDYIEIEEA